MKSSKTKPLLTPCSNKNPIIGEQKWCNDGTSELFQKSFISEKYPE